MNQFNLKPNITEVEKGKYIVIYGEEIVGAFTSLRNAIEKTGGSFTFTPLSAL